MATGASGIPIMPDLPGIKDFKGDVLHSGSYETGHKWEGKKALVIGTGNSAHDVAQDLHACGVETTQIFRKNRAKNLQNFRKSGTPHAQKLRALGQRALRILHNAAES